MSHRHVSTLRAVSQLFLLVITCCVLIVGHAAGISAANFMVGLVNTVIGIGGRGDALSANVPSKLGGTVVPPGYDYYPIYYPATIQLTASTNVSAPLVTSAITSRPGQQLIVAGYSEGTLGAEAAKRQLVSNNSGPAPSQLSFLMIASPFAGNGGIFARFPGISVPFIVDNMGAAQASPYNSEYVVNEYDPYGDFPAYFNPLSLANTLLAVEYAHPDQYYNSIVPGTTPAITTTVTNSAGGKDSYVLVYNNDLPLLAPIRQASAALGLTALTKPVLDAIEPTLRVLIDMGYTDRQNLNPATPTPFSLFTPAAKVNEAINELPGAINQGVANFTHDIQSLSSITPAPATNPESTAAKKPALTVAPKQGLTQKPTPKAVALQPIKTDDPKQKPLGRHLITNKPAISKAKPAA
ncbi:hypothetical protein M2432_001162 [Mycobacterium sp. OTB74]|nr:hypothetical protein [Mycobacterium sp. OTB74]